MAGYYKATGLAYVVGHLELGLVYKVDFVEDADLAYGEGPGYEVDHPYAEELVEKGGEPYGDLVKDREYKEGHEEDRSQVQREVQSVSLSSLREVGRD